MDDSPIFQDLIVSRPTSPGPSVGRAAAIAVAVSLHLSLLGALVLSPFLALEIMDPPKAKSFEVHLQQPRGLIRRPPGGAGHAAAIRKGGGAVRKTVQPAAVPIVPPASASHPSIDSALADPSNPISDAPPGPGLPEGADDLTEGPDGCPGCSGNGNRTDSDGADNGPGRLQDWDPRVTRAVLIPESRALPKYPDLARRARLQGTVILLIVIESDGSVGEVQVVRAPDQRWGFDLAAIEAVKRWRYRPALMNGRAVAVESQVMVEFVLSF
jgi:protein TonB